MRKSIISICCRPSGQLVEAPAAIAHLIIVSPPPTSHPKATHPRQFIAREPTAKSIRAGARYTRASIYSGRAIAMINSFLSPRMMRLRRTCVRVCDRSPASPYLELPRRKVFSARAFFSVYSRGRGSEIECFSPAGAERQG